MNEQKYIQKLDILIECFNNINVFFDNMNDTKWSKIGAGSGD